MRVQAVYDGQYNGQFYEAGDVFDLNSPGDFSDSTVNYGPNSGTVQYGWMAQVSGTTPLYQARTAGLTSVGTYFPVNDGSRRTVY